MKVFLSYSHRDEEVVRRLVDDLRQRGVSTCLDEDFISPGELWAEKLNQAVECSDAVLVIVSCNTSESKWQGSEIAFAIAAQKRDRAKKIIPVLIDHEAEVPFFLKGLLYSDLSDENRYQRNLPLLVQAIEKPNEELLSPEQAANLQLDVVKAERALLMGEEAVLHRKRSIRMTRVYNSVASVLAVCLSIIILVFGNSVMCCYLHRPGNLDFVNGALSGVLATLAVILVSWLVCRKALSAKGKDAK